MQYEIRAIKGTEAIVRLALDATDEAAARDQARAQGFTVLSARPRGVLGAIALPWRRGFPLLLFSQELLALLSAGLSLAEVFDTMVAKETRAESRKLLTGVRDRLFEGRSLSAALGEYPQAFPPLYVATVRAAERTADGGRGKAYYKSFYDLRRGGSKKALAAAIAWRDRQLKVAQTLSKREFCKIVRISNRSGIPGVHFLEPRNHARDVWQAKLKLRGGKQVTKTFSIRKYGKKGAFDLAVAARRELLAVVEDQPYVSKSDGEDIRGA